MRANAFEIYSNDLAVWVPWVVRKVAIDGRVQVESIRDPSVVRWSDLTQSRYRWFSEYVGDARDESQVDRTRMFDRRLLCIRISICKQRSAVQRCLPLSQSRR